MREGKKLVYQLSSVNKILFWMKTEELTWCVINCFLLFVVSGMNLIIKFGFSILKNNCLNF